MFMFELLVPALAAQLDRVKGDKWAYDRVLRPQLMVQAIEQLQNAQVEPDLWKIEGLDRKEHCIKVAAAARRGGRTKLVASFWAEVRTIPRFASGSRRLPRCPASSGSPWEGLFSGNRSCNCGRRRSAGKKPWPRSPNATGILLRFSKKRRALQRANRCQFK